MAEWLDEARALCARINAEGSEPDAERLAELVEMRLLRCAEALERLVALRQSGAWGAVWQDEPWQEAEAALEGDG